MDKFTTDEIKGIARYEFGEITKGIEKLDEAVEKAKDTDEILFLADRAISLMYSVIKSLDNIKNHV